MRKPTRRTPDRREVKPEPKRPVELDRAKLERVVGGSDDPHGHFDPGDA